MRDSIPASQRSVILIGPQKVALRDRPVPAPRAGELLVKIDAATTCGTDLNVFLRGMDEPLPAGEGIEIKKGEVLFFDPGL